MSDLIWSQANLEPKRKFKYLLSFSAFPEVRFLAQTCDRPGIKVGSSEHKFFDKSYFHPGKVTWDPNPLSVKLVDIQQKGGSVTDTNESLLKIFSRSGLQYFSNNQTYRTIGKAAAVDSLGLVTITVLSSLSSAADLFVPGGAVEAFNTDGNVAGGIAEQWTLHNSWLDSIKPDALDYGAEDILTVTITVKYDWATFAAANGSTVLPTI